MRKFTSLMLMLILCVSTAMADFTSGYSASSWSTRWTAATSEDISEGLQSVITNHNCTGTVYYTWNETVVSEQGDITVTVDYTGGAHKIQILGIEVVDADIADYHLGASGGSDSDNVYTLSNVPAGEYDIRVFVCDKSGDHSLAYTTGNIIYVGNITEKPLDPAAISTEHCYKIVNRAYGRLLGADGEYATSKTATDGNEQLWALEKNEDGTYYLRNVGHEKYLSYNETTGKEWTVVSENPAKFELNIAVNKTLWGEEAYAIHYNGGDEYSNAHDANWGNENGRQVVRWLADANASQWYLVETETAVNAQAVTVEYSFTYNNEEKFTQSTETFIGEEYPSVTVTFPFGVSATAPTGTIVAADATDGVIEKEIALTVNLPFAYYNSYNDITQWYYVNVRDDNPTYMYYDSSITYIKATASSVPSDAKDAYTWAFIGDPFNGFKVVNRLAGETMVLSSPETPNANQNAEQIVRMVTEESATGNTYWDFVKPTHSGAAANGFYIQHPTAKSYALNRQSYSGANTLCYWTGRDTGSVFQLVERDFSGTDELQALIDQVDAAIALYGNGGTTVGYYTAESTTALAAALAAAKTAVADPERTLESNTAAQTNLMAAVAALETIQPTAGKFYTIASASTQNNDSRTGDMIYVNNAGGMQFADANTGLGHVFQFVDAGNGQFYLYNTLRSTYLNTAKGHGYGQETATATTTDAAVKVTISNMGCDNIVKIVPEGGAMIHAQVDYSVIVGWDNEAYDNGSAWRIVEVEDPSVTAFDVTIGEAGYSTLYLGSAVTIPEGVEAYTVASLENGEANLAAVEGAIPAKTAVILKKADGQPAEATAYSFNYTENAVAVGENLLLGSTIDTYVEGPAYILAMPEGKEVGLYTVALDKDAAGAEGTTHFKNNALKAYMLKDVANNTASYGFRLPGSTGVENVTVENGVETIFDLTGRKIESVTAPGIYIINGKKVLVK